MKINESQASRGQKGCLHRRQFRPLRDNLFFVLEPGQGEQGVHEWEEGFDLRKV